MSNTTETKSEATPIRQRLVMPIQSVGELGKSLTADGLISLLKFAGVPHAGVDLDPRHHTLSDRHDGIALVDATHSEDAWGDMIDALPTDAPTIILDIPSNATDRIIAFVQHFGLLKIWRQSSVRLTLLIFASDGAKAKDSAYDAREFFGDEVDYLLIENSAQFKSEVFKQTPLYDWFVARHTPTVTIPRISSGTLAAWDAAQHEAGRGLSLDAVCKLRSPCALSPMRQVEMAGIRDLLLAQFENCTSKIVPDPDLIKHHVPRVTPPQIVRPANRRYGNPELVRK